MIFVGLGANLAYEGNSPQRNMEKAVEILGGHPQNRLKGQSRIYVSAPVGGIEQPDFLNGVIAMDSGLEPLELMALLLEIERSFGRERAERWGPRTLDLDLIDYDGQIIDLAEGDNSLHLPHPRLHERAFVLKPLAEIAPDWRHPVSDASIGDLLAEIGPDQTLRPL